MNRLWGALLLLLGCWQTGRCFYWQKQNELRRIELLLDLLREMENEAVQLETPLPQLLSRLERTDGLTSSDYAPLPTGDFPERWKHFASALPVSAEVREAMEQAGLSLCRSHEPEKVLVPVRQKLERSRREAEASCAERKRLAPALGACGGALLALILW